MRPKTVYSSRFISFDADRDVNFQHLSGCLQQLACTRHLTIHSSHKLHQIKDPRRVSVLVVVPRHQFDKVRIEQYAGTRVKVRFEHNTGTRVKNIRASVPFKIRRHEGFVRISKYTLYFIVR